MMEEITDEEMFNKYMEEQKARTLITQPVPESNQSPLGVPGQPPTLTIEEQNTLTSIQNQPAPSTNSIKPSQGECPECGMFHPPTGGKPCPNASVTNTTEKIDDAKVNTYLVQWRNIILSHIQKLGIKEWEKVFQEGTMMFAKGFDGNKKDE
jgi:hypothetical protein